MLSSCWPNYQALAGKCAEVASTLDKGGDINMYQTTGQVKKQKRKAGQAAMGETATSNMGAGAAP